MTDKSIYSEAHFGKIAAAIGRSLDEVRSYKTDFESAAIWYRLSVPPDKRESGPTLELRNQRIKAKETSGLRRRRSTKPRTPLELRRKARQVEAAARKLLLHLGVRRLGDAPDGPGDRELLTFLASFSGSSEDEVIGATARIGRLAELLEAIGAAKDLKARADKAAHAARGFAQRLPKGHQGDIATIEWMADMMFLYRRITGKEPRFSVLRPGPGRGQPAGRFLRFLQAAGEPLEIELSPFTARSRHRRLKRTSQRRQK
jgi:hypothetical protein